jgi:hypothetical protein
MKPGRQVDISKYSVDRFTLLSELPRGRWPMVAGPFNHPTTPILISELEQLRVLTSYRRFRSTKTSTVFPDLCGIVRQHEVRWTVSRLYPHGAWPNNAPAASELRQQSQSSSSRNFRAGPEAQINDAYIGHHLFDWKRPRSVWFESQKPVYFDFGSETAFLLRLEVYRMYGDRALWCVQYVPKQFVIESNGGTYATPASGIQ